LFEFVVETVLGLLGEGVALAWVERRQGWLVGLIVVFVFDEEVLLVAADHPAEVILFFVEAAGKSGGWLALLLGRWGWLRLQVGEGIDESSGEVLLIILEARLSGLEPLSSDVLDLELEHSAGDAGQVYIKITLHQ
jgi:hypothetical protein